MNQEEFVKYWREKQSEKYFAKCVPNFANVKTFERIIHGLNKVEDFRKLNYDDRVAIMKNIFGNSEGQYNNIDNEIKTAINIGKCRNDER